MSLSETNHAYDNEIMRDLIVISDRNNDRRNLNKRHCWSKLIFIKFSTVETLLLNYVEHITNIPIHSTEC